MTFWQRVFGFVNVQMPDQPQGDYRTGSILLRVFGWLQAVGLALGLLFAVILVPILFVIGAIGDATTGSDVPFGVIMLIVGFAVIIGLLVGAAMGLAWLYWIGWILEHWAGKDVRAVHHSKIFAIVQLVLTAVSIMFLIGSTAFNAAIGAYDDTPFGPGFNFIGIANPMTLVQIGISIWLLVLVSKPEVQVVFEAPA